MGDYGRALAAGSDLSASDRAAIAEKLHQYTGLPVEYILKADLRIDGGEFRQNLQGDSSLTTGRLDSRFSGPDIDPLSQRADYDRSPRPRLRLRVRVQRVRAQGCATVKTRCSSRASAPSVAGTSHTSCPGRDQAAHDLAPGHERHARSGQRHETQPQSESAAARAGTSTWRRPSTRASMRCITSPIPQNLQGNIEYKFYESGHMVYAKDAALKQLHDNVADFIRRTQQRRSVRLGLGASLTALRCAGTGASRSLCRRDPRARTIAPSFITNPGVPEHVYVLERISGKGDQVRIRPRRHRSACRACRGALRRATSPTGSPAWASCQTRLSRANSWAIGSDQTKPPHVGSEGDPDAGTQRLR